MTDRDTFAAAALTGLINTHAVYHKEPLGLAVMAYAMADAMLRERDKTNHDAAPAARAESDEARTDKAATSHLRDGTSDTKPMPDAATDSGSVTAEPVAWAVMERDGFGIDGTFTDRDDACEWCDNRQQIVPLYRSPTLTDEEREAVEHFATTFKGPMALKLRNLLERKK